MATVKSDKRVLQRVERSAAGGGGAPGGPERPGWAAGLGQGRWLLVAAGAYLGLTFAVFEGFLSPLRVGPWVLLGFIGFAHVGLGLATGTPAVLALSGVAALVALVERVPAPVLLKVGVIGVPVLLTTAGLGLLLHRGWLDPASDPGPRRRHRLGAAGMVVLGLGLSPFAAAGFRHLVPRDGAPVQEDAIDETSGSYRAISLGESYTDLLPAYGWPFKRGRRVKPSRQDVRAGHMRYSTVVYGIYRGRVSYIETTNPSAQTAAGVGIGDNLGVARRAYPGLKCGPVQRPTRSVPVLVCGGRVGPQRYLSFWSDPITEIRISAKDRSPP